jgi:hypothetical protein
MEKARYGSIHGPLVDPVEFHTRATADYKQKGILPYCDGCREVVHLYGVHTPNRKVIPRFDHADLPADADSLDDCVLANRNDLWRGLQPDGYDDARGQKIRAQFMEPAFLAKAYVFCLSLCRAGNLPQRKFRSMLQRADRKRVWAYADIEVWTIPYILLSLENFSAKAANGRGYEVNFVFKKPRGTGVAALWTHQQDCKILKVFSGGKEVRSSDNPYPVSEAAFLEKSHDTSWITPSFLQALVP